jgi:uncharacterized membrane protein YuzA (DUF378 family)
MTKKCTPANVAYWLVVIGAVNWGLIGIAGLIGDSNWNVVDRLLGNWQVIENIVYLLVGLSAIVLVKGCKCGSCKDGVCGTCDSGAGNCKGGDCSGKSEGGSSEM